MQGMLRYLNVQQNGLNINMTTMTDKELLVNSALAVGLKVEGVESNVYVTGQGRMNAIWNPLENLSDAFELANFAGLCVDFEDAVAIHSDRDVWIGSDKELPHPMKICRAIVLAAVEQYEERRLAIQKILDDFSSKMMNGEDY